MFLIGLLIHTIFLYSIFDIYFKSPIVRNVVPYQPLHEHVADRLVLFIVDGLRAESFTDHDTMEYMRNTASTDGLWGISNTRVPTESRPGHVAVIAGFYEDPSAIMKGWKENPVDFDSLFNQTLFTWCWGTYDIVDIFTKGTVDGHITVNKFDPYHQTFSTDKNTTYLDSWVFNNVKVFFEEAKSDPSLQSKLHNKKIVFFLHLLGTDTSGHTHKPKTENFLTTVRHVDNGIREIVQIIQEFYNNDGRTTFLMTSDHGMTDWGSHGAGDEHETQTPYVLWGAGINQEKGPLKNMLPDNRRLDINQADLTPLMASILSIPVPVNSIGKLPASLLNMTLANKAKAIYSNSRQLAAQYTKKRMDVESTVISALYQPFQPLTEEKYNEFIAHTEKLLRDEHYEELISFSESLMELSLQGLTYYHNYYQYPLLILVTLAFMGWILYLLKKLMLQNMNSQTGAQSKRKSIINTSAYLKKTVDTAFLILGLLLLFIVYEQSLPIQYYLYFLLPVILWWNALTPMDVWLEVYKKLEQGCSSVALEFIFYILGCLAMGLSFTYRWMLCIPLVGMGIWPILSSSRKQTSHKLIFVWTGTCLLLSAFTFMPVVGKEVYIEIVILSGLIWLCICLVYIWKLLVPFYKNGMESKREVVLSLVQAMVLLISLRNIYVQSKRFDEERPVSHADQLLAWIIAIVSMVMPAFHSRRLVPRVMAVCTSMFTFYLLLSVLHEGLFLVSLMVNSICWILMEFRLAHSGKAKIEEVIFNEDIPVHNKSQASVMTIERSVSRDDFRRAFFFLLYIIIAFFGTGNIASLNSFEVRWVTCFVTSFQPFLITGLILMKTLTPFLCVATSFRAVQHITKAPTGFLNMIVLAYSNIMGIQLLFYVKNVGSWLEIGTSISQFVIVQVITLFIVIINQLAKFLTDVNLYKLTTSWFTAKKKTV